MLKNVNRGTMQGIRGVGKSERIWVDRIVEFYDSSGPLPR